MMLEQLPDVQKLPANEKRLLAEELWQAAQESEDYQDEVEIHPAILELLDQRLDEYQADTGAVSTWQEVKSRIFKR